MLQLNRPRDSWLLGCNGAAEVVLAAQCCNRLLCQHVARAAAAAARARAARPISVEAGNAFMVNKLRLLLVMPAIFDCAWPVCWSVNNQWGACNPYPPSALPSHFFCMNSVYMIAKASRPPSMALGGNALPVGAMFSKS